MYLKRLEIYGFKTFAESVDLEFGPGITAIVGPNGSGKSNISDAVLWVLGEQGSKAIRTNRSTDVIFNGSDAKRALGLAEVHLTLDNSSGMLPTEFSEVTVSRRVFRSGESEYLINKVPVRLRDVQDLFLDTGIGKQSYSIISQGEVDAVLSSRSEDRRALFEEAAGINKYKHRKRETQRKLEQTRINLLRVNDIIGELENQVEPLNIAANKAQEYRELHAEERKLQLSLDVFQYNGLKQNLERSNAREEGFEKELQEYNFNQSKIEVTESVLRADLQKKDDEIESARSLLHQREMAVNERESFTENAAREYNTKMADIERLKQELLTLRADKDNFDAQIALQRGDSKKASIELLTINDEFAVSEQEVLQTENDITKTRGELSELRKKETHLFDQISKIRNYLSHNEYLLSNVDAQIKKIDIGFLDADAKLVEMTEKLKNENKRADELKKSIKESSEKLSGKESERIKTLKLLNESQQKTSELREQIAATSANIKTLSELEEEHEGYFPGVKAIFSYLKDGKLSGDFKSFSEIMTIDGRFENAFEVALGANLQDIITDTEENAKHAIKLLKENKGGRATFLPLDILCADRITSIPKDSPGIIGAAYELVTYDKKYHEAIVHALGRIIVAETLDSALKLSKSGNAKGWKSIVTLEGEVVTPAQTISGGSKARGAGLLKRKNELDKLNIKYEDFIAELGETMSALEKISVLIASFDKEIFNLSKFLETLRYDEVNIKNIIGNFEVLIKQIEEGKFILETDRATIIKDSARAKQDKTVQETELNDLEKKKDILLSDISTLTTAFQALEFSLNEKRTLANNKKVKIAELSSIVNSAEHNERQADSLKQSILNREKANLIHAEQLTKDIESYNSKSDGFAKELILMRTAVVDSQKEINNLREERAQILNNISANLELQKSKREGAEDIRERIQKAAIRSAQISTEIHLLEEKFLDEWRLLPADADKTAEPVENRGVAVLRLTEVKSLIESLGEVNMLAVEEYEKVTERLKFLTKERDDLTEGRGKLEGIIKEIDQICAEKFMAAFVKIGEHFQDIFSRLFGGGTARLSLVDTDNILDSGIDIDVQIPGKRNQNLVQLSGGERALTALSLLFAMLKVKPSPFVILDEIDAPLDEANVGRYGEILRDFTRETQFLTVTHNKGTMEIADVLYGVTMEKAGISKIVSVKLT